MKEWIKNILFEICPAFFPKYNLVENGGVGVCTLLCHRDVKFFIWNLTSFFYFSGKKLPVIIMDDGSLTMIDKQNLKKHFSVTFENKVGKYRKFKKLNYFINDEKVAVLRKKLYLLLQCRFEKYIYMDDDILFFDRPVEIINWLENKVSDTFYTSHNSIPEDCYGDQDELVIRSFRKIIFEKLKIKKPISFNSGLICLKKSNLNKSRLEEILKYFYQIGYEKHWLTEETAVAYGLEGSVKLLPTNRYLNVWIEQEYLKYAKGKKVVSIHYSGFVKKGRYKIDALRLAWRTRLFWKFNYGL